MPSRNLAARAEISGLFLIGEEDRKIPAEFQPYMTERACARRAIKR